VRYEIREKVLKPFRKSKVDFSGKVLGVLLKGQKNVSLTTMKFYEKYSQLREKGFLTQVLATTVFSTMSLENQQVSMPKVEEIVLALLKEKELKGGQFFSD
jgi:hypothetical protein